MGKDNHVEIMNQIPKDIFSNDAFLSKLKSAVEIQQMNWEERLAYELSLSAERDFYACMDYSYEEGREKEKKELILRMKEVGMDLVLIARIVKMSEEEVEKLS